MDPTCCIAAPTSPPPPPAAPGEFVKYDKIELGSGREGAMAVTADANKYVVTEKVHGANFCVIASLAEGGDARDGAISVKFARRTAIIGGADDAEDFFNCRSVGLLHALAPRGELVLRHLIEEAAAAEGRVIAVHIYGELFGGSYPHPQVDRVHGLQAVQKGVWYSPTLEFIGFDVAVQRESSEPSGSSRRFLDFSDAKSACEACGLMFVQPLFAGSLAECLDFGFEFETMIPSRLGLPPLPRRAGCGSDGRNLAEGVVVRPAREPQALFASRSARGARGLFKRKIEAFSERQVQNNDRRRGKAGGGGGGQLSGEALLEREIAALVTEQRLANVLSKMGRVDRADREACRALLQALKDDVAEEMDPGAAATLRGSPALAAVLESLCREVITRGLSTSRRAQPVRPATIADAPRTAVVRS